MAQHFTVDRPKRVNGHQFKSRAGGYARAKRYWVCKACALIHDHKPDKCTACKYTALYYFDSQKEMKRYYVLKRRFDLKRITDLIIKPIFDFPMTDPAGRETIPFKYVADFEYMSNGQRVVEDVKPSLDRRSWDPLFKLKMRCMKSRYGIDITIIANPEI